MLHHFGKKIYGLVHHFAVVQEIDYVESFNTLWEGVCTYLFSFTDYVFKSEYVGRKNHSYDSPPSSDDEFQEASPHVFCIDYIDALVHDHGVHNFFTKSFIKNQFNQIIQVEKIQTKEILF